MAASPPRSRCTLLELSPAADDGGYEQWPYLDEEVLVASRSRKVCLTCHWFRHHAVVNCIPLLTCQLHQGLLAHGEHLTRRCQGWTDDLTRQRGSVATLEQRWQPLLALPTAAAAQGRLHEIDMQAGASVTAPEAVTTPSTRDRYLLSTLIEEAITSSQMEGAATTRDGAKAMIRSRRAPRDRSEQMILNNYRTMQRIRELKDQPLTPQLVLDLHRLVFHVPPAAD